MQKIPSAALLDAMVPARRKAVVPGARVGSFYIPALDGLRAVSILLVMFSHAGLQHAVPGGLGVTIFFVISGYLITSQIITEVMATGRLNLRAFYLRRVFRLAPALLVFLAVMAPVSFILGGRSDWAGLAASVLYVANYWDMYVGFHSPSAFPILWSLSVEEHFYLLFPLVVTLFIPNLRRLAWPLLVACALALLWRLRLHAACTAEGASWALCGLKQAPGAAESVRIYHGTDTRFDTILAGSLMALAVAFAPRRWMAWVTGRAAFAISLVLLLLTLVLRNLEFRDTIRYSLQEAATAVAIAFIVYGNAAWLRRLFSLRPMIYVGRLSYSLYLYHFGLLMAINATLGEIRWPSARFYLYFAGSFILAVASYHLVEQPMVRVRRRFGSHAGERPRGG